MNYDNVVKDFAKRTQANLDFIENARENGEQVFEVSQLINSLLGLLVLPREKYVDSIPKIPINDLLKDGWPEIKPTHTIKASDGFREIKNLRELIIYLRNAIAHFNIMFQVDEIGEIAELRLWNTHKGVTTWEVDIPLEDLKLILRKFTQLLFEHPQPHQKRFL